MRGVVLLTGLPQSSISVGQPRISPGAFTDDPGCKSNFTVVFKNLFRKQNNNPGQRTAQGPGWDLCFFITSSPHHLFKGQEGTMSACVPQCLCFCTCVTERLRESLSKLIR